MGKPEGKRQRGKPGRRWEYNTTTVFQEMGGGMPEMDLSGSG